MVDKTSEKAIIEIIRHDFPDSCICGEEGGRSGESDIVWHVDPLDGTTNYKSGFRSFCVSIGIEKQGCFTMGVIYDPVLDLMYEAEDGKGAFLNGKKIAVTNLPLSESLMVVDSSMRLECAKIRIKSMSLLRPHIRRFRMIGSVALQLTGVATGTFAASVCDHFHSWDIAAGCVIVKEAGGEVSDLDGNPPTSKSKVLLVSNNKENHNKLLKILQEAYS
ncbi:inositol monophosphatase family protein [Nanoarchaeota archaeon]